MIGNLNSTQKIFLAIRNREFFENMNFLSVSSIFLNIYKGNINKININSVMVFHQNKLFFLYNWRKDVKKST